jgi:hypothetical protein
MVTGAGGCRCGPPLTQQFFQKRETERKMNIVSSSCEVECAGQMDVATHIPRRPWTRSPEASPAETPPCWPTPQPPADRWTASSCSLHDYEKTDPHSAQYKFCLDQAAQNGAQKKHPHSFFTMAPSFAMKCLVGSCLVAASVLVVADKGPKITNHVRCSPGRKAPIRTFSCMTRPEECEKGDVLRCSFARSTLPLSPRNHGSFIRYQVPCGVVPRGSQRARRGRQGTADHVHRAHPPSLPASGQSFCNVSVWVWM